MIMTKCYFKKLMRNGDVEEKKYHFTSENEIGFNNKMHCNSYVCIYNFNKKVYNYSEAFQTIFHINTTKKTKIGTKLEVLSSISKISFIYYFLL